MIHKTKKTLILFIALVGMANAVWAQSIVNSLPDFNFDNAVLAKIYQDDNGQDLVGIISFEESDETETITVAVRKFRFEVRTRDIKNQQGQWMQQSYQVKVPYTETVERQQPKMLRRRVEIPLGNVQFFQANGLEVDRVLAKRLLKDTTRCIAYDSSKGFGYGAEGVLSYLKDDVFILRYDSSSFAGTTKILTRNKSRDANPWQPCSLKPSLSLKRLAIAKVSDNRDEVPVLNVIAFSNGEEKQTRTRTAYSRETRTRMWTDPFSGVEKVVEYTVKVPFTTMIEGRKLVQDRYEIPMQSASVWTVDGQQLTLEDLQGSQGDINSCLLLPPDQLYYSADPFYSSMLKKDVLVVGFQQSMVKKLSEGTPSSKNTESGVKSNSQSFQVGDRKYEVSLSRAYQIDSSETLTIWDRLDNGASSVLDFLKRSGVFSSISYEQIGAANVLVRIDKGLDSAKEFKINFDGVGPVDVDIVLLNRICKELITDDENFDQEMVEKQRKYVALTKALNCMPCSDTAPPDQAEAGNRIKAQLPVLYEELSIEHKYLVGLLAQNIMAHGCVAQLGTESLEMTRKQISKNMAAKEFSDAEIELCSALDQLIVNFDTAVRNARTLGAKAPVPTKNQR